MEGERRGVSYEVDGHAYYVELVSIGSGQCYVVNR